MIINVVKRLSHSLENTGTVLVERHSKCTNYDESISIPIRVDGTGRISVEGGDLASHAACCWNPTGTEVLRRATYSLSHGCVSRVPCSLTPRSCSRALTRRKADFHKQCVYVSAAIISNTTHAGHTDAGYPPQPLQSYLNTCL